MPIAAAFLGIVVAAAVLTRVWRSRKTSDAALQADNMLSALRIAPAVVSVTERAERTGSVRRAAAAKAAQLRTASATGRLGSVAPRVAGGPMSDLWMA